MTAHCTTVQMEPSKACPGSTNVVIFARSVEAVQAEIFALADRWSAVEFTMPARCADGRWGVMGRVWNSGEQS